MRTLSLNFREAIAARESGEVAVLLLTITHPSTSDIYRLSTDPTQRLTTDPLQYGTISRGDTFYFVGMRAQLPDEKDRTPPQSKLIVGNVDRGLIPLIRAVDTPAQVLMEGVLASDPDTVEFSVNELDIVGAEYNAAEISFELSVDGMSAESFPAGSFTPASFPGLFG